MSSESSTTAPKSPRNKQNNLTQSHSSSEFIPPQESNQLSTDNQIVQDELIDSIFDLCQNMRQISSAMDTELREDSNVLDKFADTVNKNQSQVQKINKETQRALNKKMSKQCVNFSTLGFILLIYSATRLIIKLVPPHPFGLK